MVPLTLKVYGCFETIDYASIIKAAYPINAIQLEPFVGFKVLLRDTGRGNLSFGQRLDQVSQNLGFTKGKGCLLRETDYSKMTDGFWLMTLPVPRSQVHTAISNMIFCLKVLEQQFGIVRTGIVEIAVSGRCTQGDEGICLSQITLPGKYPSMLVNPDNTAYRYGHVIRINNQFMLFRTRWNFTQSQNMYDDLMILSQLISTIYH